MTTSHDLAALVARHLAWRGGEALLATRALRIEGSLRVSGLTGRIVRWYDRAGRVREDMDLGPFGMARGFDVDGGWTRQPSGQVEGAAEGVREEARRLAAVLFGDALEGGGATVEALPDEPRDGVSWKVVRVRFGDGDAWDLFLAGDTGALHGYRARADRTVTFTRTSDWRAVAGALWPFREETTSDAPGDETAVVVETCEAVPAIEGSLLARPSEAKTVSFRDGKASTGPIPFVLYDDNRVFFPASVNGHETEALLDSGAELTTLDRAFAATLGLADGPTVAAQGTGGHATASLASGVTIEVGDLVLSGLTVAVIDLGEIGKRLGRPLPLVLGKEVFNGAVVDLDFPARTIEFHHPAGFRPPTGAIPVPLGRATGFRTVLVSIEGRAPIPVEFDLGNGTPLLVFPAYAEAERLLEGRRVAGVMSGAVGGMREASATTLRFVEVAGVRFHDVPATIPRPGVQAVDREKSLGNLGLPILARFRLLTDYSRDRLLLIANPEALGRPFTRDRLGLLFVPPPPEDVFVVQFVAGGSPAESAGFRAGDRIVAIDDRPAASWRGGPLRALSRGVAGTPVAFTLSDGSTRRLVLADYY